MAWLAELLLLMKIPMIYLTMILVITDPSWVYQCQADVGVTHIGQAGTTNSGADLLPGQLKSLNQPGDSTDVNDASSGYPSGSSGYPSGSSGEDGGLITGPTNPILQETKLAGSGLQEDVDPRPRSTKHSTVVYNAETFPVDMFAEEGSTDDDLTVFLKTSKPSPLAERIMVSTREAFMVSDVPSGDASSAKNAERSSEMTGPTVYAKLFTTDRLSEGSSEDGSDLSSITYATETAEDIRTTIFDKHTLSFNMQSGSGEYFSSLSSTMGPEVSTSMRQDDRDATAGSLPSQHSEPTGKTSKASTQASDGTALITEMENVRTNYSGTTGHYQSPELDAVTWNDTHFSERQTEDDVALTREYTSPHMGYTLREGQQEISSRDISFPSEYVSTVSTRPDPETTYSYSDEPKSKRDSADLTEQFTTNDVTSKTSASSSTRISGGFKITSDDFNVSRMSQTRRQPRSTRSQLFQQTTADFTSTVPANADRTSNVPTTLSPTTRSETAVILSDTTVAMDTTSATVTESMQTTAPAVVGMQCQSNATCSTLEHSFCRQDVCFCHEQYHPSEDKSECVREPYNLTINRLDDKCLRVSWLGGGHQYNVSVSSLQSGVDIRRVVNMSTETEMCSLIPGSSTSVSVVLSNGGQPEVTSIILPPLSPRILSLHPNETCITVVWEPAEGVTDSYILEIRKVISQTLKVIASNHTTEQTEWTQCDFRPGTMVSVCVAAVSHSTISECSSTTTDSTLPSAPINGSSENMAENGSHCLRLSWAPGEGQQHGFKISYQLEGQTKNVTIDRPTDTELTVCDLFPGVGIVFSVIATSLTRTSKPLFIQGCTEPEGVQNVSIGDVDAFGTTLVWIQAGKGSVENYIITGNHSDQPLYISGSNRHATIADLSPGTYYTFNVTAASCNLTSLAASITVNTNFSSITSFNATAEGTTLQISWDMDQDIDVPVQLEVIGGGLVFTKEIQKSPYIVNTNHSGVCFTINLTVKDSMQKRTIHSATQPASPQQVQQLHSRRLPQDHSTVNVTWVSPRVTNGIITHYQVDVQGQRGLHNSTYTRDECINCQLECPPSIQSSVQSGKFFSEELTGLSMYENYEVTVTAYTVAGAGSPSHYMVGGQLLDTVNDINILVLNSTCFHITWTTPENADQIRDVYFFIKYAIFGNSSDDFNEIRIKNTTETHALLCGLEFWSVYEVNITAINQEGSGATSTQCKRTSEHEPGAVTNLSLNPQHDIYSPRTLDVTWAQPHNPYGVIQHYYLVVRDMNTTKLVEERVTLPNRSFSSQRKDGYTETLQLIGDHFYHVQVFGATSAGNGTVVEKFICMPAGVVPASNESVKINRGSVDSQSAQAHIPASLLCNFSHGLPVHAGYIVYHRGWNDRDVENKIVPGSTPAVITPWAETHSAFFVPVNVFSKCNYINDGYVPVKVGDPVCAPANGGGSGCGGPLTANTEYLVLGVYCTSVACTYSQRALSFVTKPQPEPDGQNDSTGLAVGLSVFFLVVFIAAGYAFIIYKKKPWKSVPVQSASAGQAVSVEMDCRSRQVKLEDFIDHVDQLHRDSNLGFSDEYKTIKDMSPKYPTKAAELIPCKPKNRYLNILPWDQSRVKLIPTDDEEGSDYINANYLPGENHQREFIAAQGPLPATVDDFWRMVWENRVCVIVMLTQCVEKGKTKCEKYWPDEGVQTIYGDLTVRVRSQSVLPDYIIRVIDIQLGNQSRMVKHFHFMRWPDHGCPERTSMLLNFVSSVRAHMPHSGAGPTLVHCSAGVGRTGTFIALDRLLQQIRQGTEVDIFSLVLTMREHRMQMVQTENQYVYIHDCLVDALTEDKESDDDPSDDDGDEHIYGNC